MWKWGGGGTQIACTSYTRIVNSVPCAFRTHTPSLSLSLSKHTNIHIHTAYTCARRLCAPALRPWVRTRGSPTTPARSCRYFTLWSGGGERGGRWAAVVAVGDCRRAYLLLSDGAGMLGAFGALPRVRSHSRGPRVAGVKRKRYYAACASVVGSLPFKVHVVACRCATQSWPAQPRW